MKRPYWRITTAEPSRGQPRPTEPSRAEQDITDEDRALLDINSETSMKFHGPPHTHNRLDAWKHRTGTNT